MPFDAVSQANHNQQDDIMDEHDDPKVFPIDQAKSNTGRKKGNSKARGKANGTKTEKPKPPRIGFGVVSTVLCRYMEGKGRLPKQFDTLERFPYTIRPYYLTDRSAALLLELDETNKLASYKSLEHISGYVLEAVKPLMEIQGGHKYIVDSTQAIKIVKAFKLTCPPLAMMPQSFAFKSQMDNYAFMRLPFDPIPTTEDELRTHCPIFSGFLKRMRNNSLPFCQRIGSIFYPDADRKQAVWLFGPKDSGKSTMLWLIEQFVGHARLSMTIDDIKDPFFLREMIGKRVIIGDEMDPAILNSSWFKRHTGKREFNANVKHKDRIETIIDFLLFCASNHPPAITNDSAAQGRVIACKMDPLESKILLSEVEIKNRLLLEMPRIAGYCQQMYLQTGGARISCNMEDLEEGSVTHQAEFHGILETYFERGQDYKTPILQVWGLLDKHIKTSQDQKAFKEFLLNEGMRIGRPRATKDQLGVRPTFVFGLKTISPPAAQKTENYIIDIT